MLPSEFLFQLFALFCYKLVPFYRMCPFSFHVLYVYFTSRVYQQSGMNIQFAVTYIKFTSWVAQFELTDRHSYAHHFFSAGWHHSTAQWEGLCEKRKCKCKMLIPYILLNIQNCGIWFLTDIFWTPWGRSKDTLCVYSKRNRISAVSALNRILYWKTVLPSS